MKKILFTLVALLAVVALPSCNQKKLEQAQERNAALTDSLAQATSAQNELLSLVNEINTSMLEIKEIEQLMVNSDLATESVSQKNELETNISVIKASLAERREKIEELEKKLNNNIAYSANLKKTIETLKAQIATQEESIAQLQSELGIANAKISTLNTEVETLNTTVANVTNEKEIAQQESLELTNELNTCYYIIGSKSELKEANVIETAFLKKTKVMEADYEMGAFTKADKRTIREIPLNAKKDKIYSTHPEGSYTITENANGLKTLVITNPAKFWELSNYLVIRTY